MFRDLRCDGVADRDGRAQQQQGSGSRFPRLTSLPTHTVFVPQLHDVCCWPTVNSAWLPSLLFASVFHLCGFLSASGVFGLIVLVPLQSQTLGSPNCKLFKFKSRVKCYRTPCQRPAEGKYFFHHFNLLSSVVYPSYTL
jgi:hypothetical protein